MDRPLKHLQSVVLLILRALNMLGWSADASSVHICKMSTTATSTRGYRGPLTTTWTPPAQCTVFGANDLSAPTLYLGLHCSGGVPRDETTCWPPALVSNSVASNLNGYGYYSPGLICPSGYTSACAQNNSGSLSALQTFKFQFPPIDDETAVGCCPTGMVCANPGSAFQQCLSTSVSSGASFTVGFCGTPDTYTETSTLFIGESTPNFQAPLIQLIYKATDVSSGASATSVLQTTVASGPNPSSTPSSDSSNDSGLSNGAKIGIGVGVPLAILLLGALAYFFFRRRQQRPVSIPIGMAHEASNESKDSAISRDRRKSARNIELDGVPAPTVHELYGGTGHQ